VLGAALRGIGALGKGAMSMGKNFMGGLKGAATTGGRTATGQFAKAGKGAKMANTAGKAISKNPVKTSLATGVAGAGLGYALGGKPGEDPTTTIADTNKKPNQSATPVNPTPATPDEDPDMQELDVLAREFGDSEDPEIAELLKQYSDVKNAQLK
jgi:hypothetical protein